LLDYEALEENAEEEPESVLIDDEETTTTAPTSPEPQLPSTTRVQNYSFVTEWGSVGTAEGQFRGPQAFFSINSTDMYTWRIQVTTEYKYSPVIVLSLENGDNLEQTMVSLTSLEVSL
jgi:hypothetical protein